MVGRDEELAMLDEQVGVRSSPMVVAGAVGVGKSRLLTGWLSGLEAQGRATVVVRATKSTATIPFGAFARWVPERLGDSRDRLGILQATAARLAKLGPDLVVAVDDAQLLDDGSAALVLHMAQHTSLGVLVTVRSGVPCPDAIVALWKERLALRLDLQPLSEPQTVELLERALGDSVAPATQQRLWTLSEGNPMYLKEVVDAGRAQGVLTRSAGMWRWQGVLAGRTRLVELVSDRIGASGSAERRVLEIVALGEPLAVDMLVRLAPRALLTELEARGLVVTEQQSPDDPGLVARLAHPLYSEVLRAELPTFRAQSHNLALAEAALAAGAHERDPLRVATWLLDSGEEPGQPELLLQAAFVAQIIDDFELSVRLAEAAERANGGWRATVRRAEALGPLQRWDEADALLSALSSSSSEPEAQAAAARIRAEQAFWCRGEDLAVARGILAEAAKVVPAPARSSLLAHSARLAITALDLEEAIRLATSAVADADSLVDRLNGITCAGFAAVLQGRAREAMAIVELAAPYAFEVFHRDPAPGGYAAYTYSHVALLEGRIDEAAEIFEILLQQDIVRIGGPAWAFPTFLLAGAALAQGRMGVAVRLCREALGILGDENHFEASTPVAILLASAAAQSGDPETAATALAWLDAHVRVHTGPEGLATDLARAWLNASRGEMSSARDLALATARRAGRAKVWFVEMTALHDAARLGAAAVAAPRLAELSQIIDGPYPVAAALAARAAATRDGAGLDDAAARFAAMGARLLAAEAATAAADVHAAEGRRRDYAASLANAQRLAAQCESASTPMLARLDHAPAVTALTDREREVTELAARGRTSREIATTLTISVRTVDSHLNHAYTKLGISDRAKLATILGHDPDAIRNRD